MKRPRYLIPITLVLAFVSLGAFILARLAITDIYHGETDLRLEWGIVEVSFLPILLFHAFAIASLIVFLRQNRESNR